jgi:putative endonuclease
VAGLVPATHVFKSTDAGHVPDHQHLAPREQIMYACRMGGWVYLMTNRPNGTLYAGCTVDLPRRAWEHREGVAAAFTKKYGLKRLVYAEWYDDILLAKQREANIKHWPRAWKVRLIHRENPFWEDLYDRLV